uniref:Uncharacterized protein n=1 Tax=Anguilla anguilla TaxID=7936 RepID=A0A0E9X5W2_ANGAN
MRMKTNPFDKQYMQNIFLTFKVQLNSRTPQYHLEKHPFVHSCQNFFKKKKCNFKITIYATLYIQNGQQWYFGKQFKRLNKL